MTNDQLEEKMFAEESKRVAKENALDAARYRFLFEERNWCENPLWPVVEFFRDSREHPKALIDHCIDLVLRSKP